MLCCHGRVVILVALSCDCHSAVMLCAFLGGCTFCRDILKKLLGLHKLLPFSFRRIQSAAAFEAYGCAAVDTKSIF